MPYDESFVDALVDLAKEKECATEGSGESFLKELRDKALVKISGGQATTLISTTMNGQTFTRQIQLAASDMFEAASAALRKFNGRTGTIFYPQWQNIPH